MTLLSTDRRGRHHTSATLLAGAALLLLAALLPIACSDDEDNGEQPVIRHPEDFLPPDTGGMIKSGDASVATDAESLQQLINGGFQIYVNNGFVEMVQQIYSGSVGGSTAEITAWIFDQGSTTNAMALHDELLQLGTYEELTGIGDSAHRKDDLFTHTILFRRNNYSSQLVINPNNQDAKDLLQLFATHIDGEILQ